GGLRIADFVNPMKGTQVDHEFLKRDPHIAKVIADALVSLGVEGCDVFWHSNSYAGCDQSSPIQPYCMFGGYQSIKRGKEKLRASVSHRVPSITTCDRVSDRRNN